MWAYCTKWDIKKLPLPLQYYGTLITHIDDSAWTAPTAQLFLFGFTPEAEEVGLVGVEDEGTGGGVVGCSVEGERDGRGVRLALPEHVMVLDEGFGAGGCGWLRKRLGGSRVERDLWMVE